MREHRIMFLLKTSVTDFKVGKIRCIYSGMARQNSSLIFDGLVRARGHGVA